MSAELEGVIWLMMEKWAQSVKGRVMAKFGRLEGGQETAHDYGNRFFRQPIGDTTRLMIGPSAGHVELLTELSACLCGKPWFLLYVLLLSRQSRREPGRYQSPFFESLAELAAFLKGFRAYFEGDGRHHIWIGSAANDGLLVYDQHNVIFAYGPLDVFEAALLDRGYRQEKFWFPSPHVHVYGEENGSEEERLMSELEWQYSALRPGDVWD